MGAEAERQSGGRGRTAKWGQRPNGKVGARAQRQSGAEAERVSGGQRPNG